MLRIMPFPRERPKTLGEAIDDLERIQGELLSLQRVLEKLELAGNTKKEIKINKKVRN